MYTRTIISMFQVFRFTFVVAYVESCNKLVAEKMVEEYLSKENCTYVGEYETIDAVMKSCEGYFIGYDKYCYDEYLKKQGGLVKFMVNYIQNDKNELDKVLFNYT